MHRGVQAFVGWLSSNPDFPGVSLGPPATASQLSLIEDSILSPLPADLRLVLQRVNGAVLPSGRLLATDGEAENSIQGTLAELATRTDRPVNDPEVLLPFYRTDDGGILAFDRTAGPVADTWPIVDYYTENDEVRLVHRTFDGWCRLCVSEWTAEDFDAPFSLQKYLAAGKRHVAIEPDVSVAHATVAHAQRRAGAPEKALASYLAAARCVPALPWCDWEALKIAVLLQDARSLLEAAGRLCARAPGGRWAERETDPVKVADVLGHAASWVRPKEALLRLFDQLGGQTLDEADHAHVAAIRHATHNHSIPPPTRPARALNVTLSDDPSEALASVKAAFVAGQLRDDDLLLHPSLSPIVAAGQGADVLRQPRGF